jgi:hypothetical protein
MSDACSVGNKSGNPRRADYPRWSLEGHERRMRQLTPEQDDQCIDEWKNSKYQKVTSWQTGHIITPLGGLNSDFILYVFCARLIPPFML